MLRVWIFVGIILLIGVLLGIWLANRARRREQSSGQRTGNAKRPSSSRPTGPDDDDQFLRSINIDPDKLADEDDK